MNTLQDLMESWRKMFDGEGTPLDLKGGLDASNKLCAEELEEWLNSLWTEITDDPASRPPEYKLVLGWFPGVHPPLAVTERGPHNGGTNTWRYARQTMVEGGPWPEYMPSHWRPLIPGLDTPEAGK